MKVVQFPFKDNPLKMLLNIFSIAALVISSWIVCVSQSSLAIGVEFHVAPEGNDTNKGTKAEPFATLERARDAARGWRANASASSIENLEAVTVWIQPGVYPRSKTFELTIIDSGTEKSPVTYRSSAAGETRLHAGKLLAPSDFQRVTNTDVVARLDGQARGKVVQVDLAKLGVKNAGPFPKMFNTGGGLCELYIDDLRMPLSRWPNESSVAMGKVLDRGDYSKGTTRRGGKFIARDDRVARWNVDSGIWLEGYWRVPWESQTVLVKSISPATREITFAEPVNGGIGSKYAKPGELGDGKEQWIAVNLLEELDKPGEWCVDFTTKTLFLWPPVGLTKSKVFLSDFDQPIITMNDVSNVTLRGLVMECGLGNGVEIQRGGSNVVAGCTFRNLSGSGVVVKGGNSHAVRSSDFCNLGKGGIYFSGGDRKTLSPAKFIAENNHLHHLGIHQKTYAAAIHVGAYGSGEAVGCYVAHNLMHDLPHAAVLYGGNNHLFEFNEIGRVGLTSGDVGAFYTWNDWTSRGNQLRYNFVYSSPHVNAFYMDDGDSGDKVFGNVVHDCSYGAFIGGGHDNLVQNNLIIETPRALHLDSRGVSRGYATSKSLIRGLESVNPSHPPWSTRYPNIVNLIDGRRDIPTGNFVENNVAVSCKELLHFSGKKEELNLNSIGENLALSLKEIGFANPEMLDFRIRQDSIVYKKMPAFKPIPFEQIGLKTDEYRTTLPEKIRQVNAKESKDSSFDSSIDVQQSNRAKP